MNKEYIDFMITPYAFAKILLALHTSGVRDYAVTQEDNELHIRIEKTYLESIVYKIKNKQNTELSIAPKELENGK